MRLQALAQRMRPEQLVHQSVLPAHLHHVERDGGGHSEQKGLLGHDDFVGDVGHARALAKHLDNRIVRHAIDHAHAAATNFLAALHAHLPQTALHRHHLRETRHLEHAIDVGTHIGYFERRKTLPQHQHDAQAGAGNIGHAAGIPRQFRDAGSILKHLVQLLLHVRRCRCVEPALEREHTAPVVDFKNKIGSFHGHFFVGYSFVVGIPSSSQAI